MTYDHIGRNEIQFAPLDDAMGMQGCYIVYSPLTETAFVASDADLGALDDALKQRDCGVELEPEMARTVAMITPGDGDAPRVVVIDSPERYTKLSLLPNYTCNFSCSYCYSAKGRSQRSVSREALAAMIDFFVDSGRTGRSPLSIFISGGGEPMLSWDKIEFAVSRARKLAGEQDIELGIWLMTNGSLLSDQIMDGLQRYDINVGVSFELLEDVQNRQRGNFECVANNIRALIRRGILPSISSVITPYNVERMEEAVEAAIKDFTGVKHLNFDPVMTPDLFEEQGRAQWFYRTFTNDFFKAKQKARKFGITLDCNMVRKFESLHPRYCQGKLCLTPEGKISICHSISSPEEKGYDEAIYGAVDEGAVLFDHGKFASLVAPQANFTAKCRDCIAKWHCGGGCLMYRINYDEAQMKRFCDFTRDMVVKMLIMRLDIQYRENLGISLEEFLRQQNKGKDNVCRTE